MAAPHDGSSCMKVEIKEVCRSILLSILSDIVSISPVAATLTIMMDNSDNSSLSDNEHLATGLNKDIDVDAGKLNAMYYDLSASVSDNDDENDGQDDSTKSQQGRGWNILMGSRTRPSLVSISLDEVDSRLLKKARHEVPEVLIKGIKEKLFGKKKNRNMS